MAFDDIIPGPQGAIKSSEIFTDRTLPIIKNTPGETNLKVLEGMMKPIADALRYNNFLLYSDGQIVWETNLGQPRIRFNADAKANNIRLRLMMLDEAAQSRTVDIVIPATTGANSLTAFNTINMNNNDLIYMELSRDVILNAISGTPASTPAVITLENGIDGGSVQSGRRLLKVNMTGNTGMPAMVADLDSLLQDNSQTVNIPIASRYDWTDNIATYSDVWWIPHGIRWPTGTISVIGAVVASGFDALPNYFSRTITEFNQHLTQLATTGGTIAIIRPITINSPITIPVGVNIVGRTTKNDNTSPGLYFSSGGRLIMSARSSVKNLYIRGLAGFGQVANEHIIEIAGAGVQICENFFEFVSGTSTLARGVNLLTGAQDFKIERNLFTAISSSTVAINFAAASYTRARLDANQFTTITEANYATRAAALNVNNSYGIVPIGTILPWVGASMTNGSNASPASIAASYAALATMLPEGWVICDGRALPTDSPLRTGGNTFTPNMTDRYLYGVNSLAGGVVGGTFDYTTGGSTASFVSSNITVGASTLVTNKNQWNSNQTAHSHGMGAHTHSMTSIANSFSGTPQAYACINVIAAGSGNALATINIEQETVLAPVSWTTNKDSGFNANGNIAEAGTNGGGNPRTLSNAIRGNTGPANAGGVTGTASATWASVNADVTGNSLFNANLLNGVQNNHTHTVTGIKPSYLSAIYIMRYK